MMIFELAKKKRLANQNKEKKQPTGERLPQVRVYPKSNQEEEIEHIFQNSEKKGKMHNSSSEYSSNESFYDDFYRYLVEENTNQPKIQRKKFKKKTKKKKLKTEGIRLPLLNINDHIITEPSINKEQANEEMKSSPVINLKTLHEEEKRTVKEDQQNQARFEALSVNTPPEGLKRVSSRVSRASPKHSNNEINNNKVIPTRRGVKTLKAMKSNKSVGKEQKTLGADNNKTFVNNLRCTPLPLPAKKKMPCLFCFC